MERIKREEWYLKIAKIVSERSTCSRAKVGAVLVDPNTHRVVSMGFNGSPKKAKHCISNGCLMVNNHCIRTIHAELNAVLHLEHEYPELYLYSTHQPCLQCVKALVGANVSYIFYIYPYSDEGRDVLLKELNITMYKVEEPA